MKLVGYACDKCEKQMNSSDVHVLQTWKREHKEFAEVLEADVCSGCLSEVMDSVKLRGAE